MATRRQVKVAADTKPAVVTRRRASVSQAAQEPKARTRKTVIAAAAAEMAGEEPRQASYFASAEAKAENLKFFSTGCAVFDAALGGGWVLGRVSNVVGDKSSGKTLIAIEAAANFKRQYPEGHARYGESESAFDREYAEEMGMPEGVEYNPDGKPLETIEQVYDDLVRVMDANPGRPILYILDSLDAISDEDEMGEKDFNKGSYGGKKPKQISKMFRMLISRMESHPLHLMVISQIRDKIGAMIGESKTRSGGKALDFYASHVVWVAHIKTLKRVVKGIERPVGVQVLAKVKKNKVGLPFRQAEYPILFGYGIDDLTANVEWLIDNKREHCLEPLEITKAGYSTRITAVRNRGGDEARELREQLRQIVFREWEAIETSFLPKSRKY